MLNELNNNQQVAVKYCDGPSLVIAGAGSGKTRVLTYKIAYLVDKGVAPHRILALTFTNKAANEMKERIDSLLGDKVSKNLWMGTFHSIFGKFLRMEASALGFTSQFTIYDTQDSKRLVTSIIKELNLNVEYYKVKNIYARISSAKNNLITPEAYSQNAALIKEDKESRIDKFVDVYKLYWQRCKMSNVMDFDDLLLYTNILFKRHPDILEKYKKRFDYVLVDEYQDTNFAQYLIVKKLSETHRKLCVVGDDAQSIYSFRGAQIKNILNFEKDYPDYKLFKLEQNYRSTQNIVEAANSVIDKNKEQIRKNLFSKNSKGSKICIHNLSASSLEGFHVAETINNLALTKHYPHSDFAVLYRTNAQSRVIEEALRKYNIPYKVFGGLSFYQRKEIKDAIAYLRLVSNNNDTEALRRIINYPSRKIGDVTMGKLFQFSGQADIPIWEIVNNPHSYNTGINSSTQTKLKEFANLITDFTIKAGDTNVFELAEELFNKVGLNYELFQDKTPEGISRYENFQEFLNGIKEFSDNRKKEFTKVEVTVADYLENIALITDLDEKHDGKPFVSLMTIHSSKGLEFSNIFIVGAEENLFPNAMATFSLQDLEEERRLFYVAMTRAKDNLFISHCNSRFRYGSIDYPEPSRFITDISSEFVEWNKPEESSEDLGFDDERDSYSYRSNDMIVKKPIGSKEKSSKKYSEKTEIIKPKQKLVSINKIRHKANANSMINISDFVPGLNVKHKDFGIGKIMSVTGEADQAKAVIFFENQGNKTLLLKFAKLEIL